MLKRQTIIIPAGRAVETTSPGLIDSRLRYCLCGFALALSLFIPSLLHAQSLGYELFWDGRRVGLEPGWGRARAIENCKWNKTQYPDKHVQCVFDGLALGYELFWDGRRVGYEPGWSQEHGQRNCDWNRNRYPNKRVQCRFDGTELGQLPVLRMLSPSPGEELTNNNCAGRENFTTFDWTDVPGARTYMLTVYQGNHQIYLAEVVEGSSSYRSHRRLALPDSLLDDWHVQVEAYDDRSKVESTGAVEFRFAACPATVILPNWEDLCPKGARYPILFGECASNYYRSGLECICRD